MAQVLAFNKWDCSDIQVQDPGLKKYINIQPRIVPKTGARYAGNRFHKSQTFIVERLINKVMVPGHKGKKHLITSGHVTGKAVQAYNIVHEALKIVEDKLNKNPVEVLVKAIENAAPRDEIITVEYAGARYPKAVEMAPQRRVDYVLKMMVQGSYQSNFKKNQEMSKALAKEIIAAYNQDTNSTAISKKKELERQADSSR